MPLKGKGKQVAGKAPATVAAGSSTGMRKMTASKSSDGGISKRKRKRSGVLQFFDEVAAEADSDYENDGDLEMEEEDEGEGIISQPFSCTFFSRVSVRVFLI